MLVLRIQSLKVISQDGVLEHDWLYALAGHRGSILVEVEQYVGFWETEGLGLLVLGYRIVGAHSDLL